MNFLTTKEAADLLNLTTRRISGLCASGDFSGAFREGRRWQIPKNAIESFKNNRNEIKDSTARPVLPCPVGNTSYSEVSEKCYYVDKTLLIREILDEYNKVILFARPRRFGKTLTMDMLKTFFEKSDRDNSVYFRNKKIWREGKKYTDAQGRYPTIFLSFKDIKLDTWDETYESIQLLLKYEYKRHSELLASELLDDDEKDTFRRVLSQQLTYVEYLKSLKLLSDMLSKHYNEKAIILIDEYDTPIQQGYHKGFYEKVISFMKNFFSEALKDNPSLERGFLTGILRISKENLFSDLNNISVNTVVDERFSSYFGFTQDEVEKMAAYYGQEEKLPDIRQWYDGYRFGKNDIYNPWSVTSYFSAGCAPAPYWANTSSNEIVREILLNVDNSVVGDLNDLLLDKEIIVSIDTRVIYPMLQTKKDAIFTFLLLTGYLKVVDYVGDDFYKLALPNKEIKTIFRNEILNWLTDNVENNVNVANNIRRALIAADRYSLQKAINDFLKVSASFLDTTSEAFYHGLSLGLVAALTDKYIIRSNHESGYGRFDIQLEPREKSLPAMLMEFKIASDDKSLKERAEEGLAQINRNKYGTDLKDRGNKNIVGYGVAFCGKNVYTVSDIF